MQKKSIKNKYLQINPLKYLDSRLFFHKTKREGLLKFILLLLILIIYFVYLNFKFDAKTSSTVTILSWSFFVLCTPVADAGLILDFPIRVLLGIRMIYSEIMVWIAAIIINIVCIYFVPSIYNKTVLTSLFYKILITPYPFWSIIFLSSIGTFLSIKFGDELFDVIKYKDCKFYHKHFFYHKIIIIISIFILTLWLYYHLLEILNVKL